MSGVFTTLPVISYRVMNGWLNSVLFETKLIGEAVDFKLDHEKINTHDEIVVVAVIDCGRVAQR
jgi:hypothetical protein